MEMVLQMILAINSGSVLLSASSGNRALTGLVGKIMFERFFGEQSESDREADSLSALAILLAVKFETDAMLERLAALSAKQFEKNPDKIHWGGTSAPSTTSVPICARSPTAPSGKANTRGSASRFRAKPADWCSDAGGEHGANSRVVISSTVEADCLRSRTRRSLRDKGSHMRHDGLPG